MRNWDCSTVSTTTYRNWAFGKEVELTTLTLDNNRNYQIPENFCGFTDQGGGFEFAQPDRIHPQIFDANPSIQWVHGLLTTG